MDARRLAVELQLSAKRGTVSGEQVNAVVDALLEMTDKLERLEAENAKLREMLESADHAAKVYWKKLEAYEYLMRDMLGCIKAGDDTLGYAKGYGEKMAELGVT